MLDSMISKLKKLLDVKSVTYTINQKNRIKSGLEPYTIAIYIDGGDDYLIAQVIMMNKPMGYKLLGNTEMVAYTPQGIAFMSTWFDIRKEKI